MVSVTLQKRIVYDAMPVGIVAMSIQLWRCSARENYTSVNSGGRVVNSMVYIII